MPRRGRSNLVDQRVFFVTTTCAEHAMLFDTTDKLCLLRRVLFDTAQHFAAQLYGYVLMSNHVHLLIGLEGGGPQLSKFMKAFKSIAARRIAPGECQVWMHRFDDVAVYSEEQFRRKLAYIHNNPVKAGLSSSAEGYEFSSARAWQCGSKCSLVCTEAPR